MKNPKLRFAELLDHGVMMGLTPLVKARRQYLMGNFTGQDDVPGATAGYVSVRTPNEQIEAIGSSPQVRQQLGLQRTPDMTDRQWTERLQTEQYLRIQAKQNASFWLGVLHLQKHHYEVAANWFKKRTLEAWPEGRWESAARWNLAVCYQELQRPDEARQMYLLDDSPQRHGSLLRARQLETAAKQVATTSSATSSSQPTDSQQPAEPATAEPGRSQPEDGK
jgi:hypothetical protein